MSNFLSQLGRGLSGFAAGVEDPGLAFRDQKKREDLQKLAGILSGQSTPAFLRPGGTEGLTQQQTNQLQLNELAGLGTPEALKIIAAQSPLTQQRQAPVSPVGKIQQDFKAGLIDRKTKDALLKKATAPRAPLVQISSGEKIKTRETRDQLQGGIAAVDELIKELEKSPSKAGVLGAARGAVETGAGVVADITSSIPGFDALGGTAKTLLPTVGESIKGLKPLQNKLAIGLARARQGASGRLLAEQLKQARSDTSIGGLTSGQQVLDSLKQVREELSGSLADLSGRAGEAGFDLPVDKKDKKPKVIKLDANFNVIP